MADEPGESNHPTPFYKGGQSEIKSALDRLFIEARSSREDRIVIKGDLKHVIGAMDRIESTIHGNGHPGLTEKVATLETSRSAMNGRLKGLEDRHEIHLKTDAEFHAKMIDRRVAFFMVFIGPVVGFLLGRFASPSSPPIVTIASPSPAIYTTVMVPAVRVDGVKAGVKVGVKAGVKVGVKARVKAGAKGAKGARTAEK